MITGLDLLSDRVHQWGSAISDDPQQMLTGWGLLEMSKRRGPSGTHLVETIEPRLGRYPVELIPGRVEAAKSAWNQLLSDLDREEPNFEHVQRKTPDVFFLVLEALIHAEESDEHPESAEELFNAVAGDLYVFETMADIAAEMDRSGQAPLGLSDLFCKAVSGLFDGQVVARPQVKEEVEAFRPLGSFLSEVASSATLTPAILARQLQKVSWWFLKWRAQRIQIMIVPKSRDICLYVWEGESMEKLTPSKGLDGWEVKIGQAGQMATGTIQSGVVAMKLPKQIEPAGFSIQLKNGASEEWAELFGKIENNRP